MVNVNYCKISKNNKNQPLFLAILLLAGALSVALPYLLAPRLRADDGYGRDAGMRATRIY